MALPMFAMGDVNNIISATAILSARRISSSHDGIEIIKKINAESR